MQEPRAHPRRLWRRLLALSVLSSQAAAHESQALSATAHGVLHLVWLLDGLVLLAALFAVLRLGPRASRAWECHDAERKGRTGKE